MAELDAVLSHVPVGGPLTPQALASNLDLSRGRIRPWLDGGAPDAVNAIVRGAELGWFQ